MDIREIRWESVDWIDLDNDGQMTADMNMVMNLRVT
jgi:hypothetical protein